MATATISNVDALLAQASTAIGDQNYAAASDYVLRAETLLMGIPDTEKDGVSIRFRESRIARLSQVIDRRAAATAGIQRTNVEYVRPST